MPDRRDEAQRRIDTALYALHHCGTPLMCLSRQVEDVRFEYLWCPTCEVEA